jgi:hypothetical protein
MYSSRTQPMTKAETFAPARHRFRMEILNELLLRALKKVLE